MTLRLDVDADLVERYVLALGRHGAHSGTGVWRTVYSPEWVAAQQEVHAWMQDAGLEVRHDAVGNVWGRAEGSDGGDAVVSGSHIDSQTPGGRYDGALGVITAVIALRTLLRECGPPRRPLEVVSLCEEEASRFQAAGFWGTRAIIGDIAPEVPEALVGYDGATMAEAMRAVGLDPELIPEAERRDIAAFIETHIEQGPVLEDAGIPVAAVDAITGQRRYVVELRGRADHAGARPMDRRRDAFQGAAEAALEAIATARRLGRPAVTTVGRIALEPNLPSAVPETATFTIDVRHPDPATLDELYASHERSVRGAAERHGLTCSWTVPMDIRPTICDPEIVSALQEAAADSGVPLMAMQSGAGHDAQNMARRTRTAMLFARSRDGRSHTPEEFTSVPDAVAAIRVLAGALHRLAY